MLNSTRLKVRATLVTIACAGTALLTACDQSGGPPSATGPQRSIAATQSEQPYYYYYGKAQYLQVEPGQLVIESTSLSDISTAAAIGKTIGASVSDAGLLGQVPGHHLLQIAPAAIATMEAVRAALRANPAFRFVSYVYRTVDGAKAFTPVNRMAIRFRDSASPRSIDSLLTTYGAAVIRPPRPDSGFFYYVVSYPRDSIEPLRVAAHLYVNPLVQWTEPDRISAARLQSVPSDAYFTLQFHLANSNMLNGVNVDDDVERAWDLTLGNGIRVGILDDGVDVHQNDYPGIFGGGTSLGPHGRIGHRHRVGAILR